MNTTIEALQALYVQLGGELTDTYPTIALGVPVSDYTTIPNMIKALTKKSGSGGGSVLPSVTTDDNGKILMVENGEWNAENPANPAIIFDAEIDMTAQPPTIATNADFASLYDLATNRQRAIIMHSITNTGIEEFEQHDFIPLVRMTNEHNGTLDFGSVVSMGGGQLVYMNAEFTADGISLDTPIPITGSGG